jgi:hypothetical protein
MNRARWEGKSKEDVERINSEATPSCEEYETIFKKHPQFQ